MFVRCAPLNPQPNPPKNLDVLNEGPFFGTLLKMLRGR